VASTLPRDVAVTISVMTRIEDAVVNLRGWITNSKRRKSEDIPTIAATEALLKEVVDALAAGTVEASVAVMARTKLETIRNSATDPELASSLDILRRRFQSVTDFPVIS
jgi:hypothetical protein